MRTYHYPVMQVMAKQLFQRLLTNQYRVRSLLWIFPNKRSWRIKSDGSLHNKRICLLYSIFKEHLTVYLPVCENPLFPWFCYFQYFDYSIMDFHRLITNGQGRKERIGKSHPVDTVYLISTSKDFILRIMAWHTSPFSSKSTAIRTFPYSSYSFRIQQADM